MLPTPKGLHRRYGVQHLHFLTCSCYRRLPLLSQVRAKNAFVNCGDLVDLCDKLFSNAIVLSAMFLIGTLREVAMKRWTLLLVVCATATAAQSAQTGDQLAAIQAACADDAQKLCAGVQPGGGRIVACLKEHKDSLSDRCKKAAGLPANPTPSSAPGASSASPASETPAPAAPPGPTKSPSAPSATATPPAKSPTIPALRRKLRLQAALPPAPTCA